MRCCGLLHKHFLILPGLLCFMLFQGRYVTSCPCDSAAAEKAKKKGIMMEKTGKTSKFITLQFDCRSNGQTADVALSKNQLKRSQNDKVGGWKKAVDFWLDG